ncbi:MAG: hypothetical protein KAR64_09685, partial [Thermoplasmatales archaeon]|nr:hypothetical protein [Thermoplasmatales archaeon]
KKPTLTFVVILLILSVFGPMRSTYDAYQYQLDEEENACDFLTYNMPADQTSQLVIGGINFDYFKGKFYYMNLDDRDSIELWAMVPRDPVSYSNFNASFIEENEYIVYNPNLGKEIILFGSNTEEVNAIKEKMLFNNKIFGCGKTFIITGVSEAYERRVGGSISPDSYESPIREYFTTQKILWTFDDYYIQYGHHLPPHKGFGGLTEKINGYGGHVNIMVIFTGESETSPFGNEIRNYSVIDDFGWSEEIVNASLEFFNRSQVYPQCHGWNETSEELNNANMSFAYKIINHTFWNWVNNYNIKPNFFIGASTSGNYNITLALKHFSEKNWNVYGENFRWDNPDLFPEPSRDAPAVEYIGKTDFVAMF